VDVRAVMARHLDARGFEEAFGAEELRKFGTREMRVRVPSGLAGGGGVTPIEPHIKKFQRVFEEAL
jgi:hypothetical protein